MSKSTSKYARRRSLRLAVILLCIAVGLLTDSRDLRLFALGFASLNILYLTWYWR